MTKVKDPIYLPWPPEALFILNQHVQRRSSRTGKPPAYRFRGHICGWYVSNEGKMGYAVNSDNEPGCIQIYPEAGLETLP